MPTTIRIEQFKNFDEEAEDAVGTSMSGVGGISVIYQDDSDLILISGTQGVTDHGLLTGLADDDHIQYILANGTRSFSSDITVTGTIKLTNLTNGYLPYHVSDAAGLANSVIYNSGTGLEMVLADGGAGFCKIEAATGRVRIYPYLDATYGACIESMNAAETSYLPMTLSANKFIFWLASSGTTFQIGSGQAGIDYALTFNGETNDGTITWREDEADFDTTFIRADWLNNPPKEYSGMLATIWDHKYITNFTGYGVYSWDGTSWVNINPYSSGWPNRLFNWKGNLYGYADVAGGAPGLFKYLSPGSWTDLTGAVDIWNVVDAGDFLLVYESRGIYMWDGASYTVANAVLPDINKYMFTKTVAGSLISGGTLTLKSTMDATKGSIITDSSLVLPSSTYLNFGGVVGSGSYGFRDNAGSLEYKNSGGAWNSISGSTTTAHGSLTGLSNDDHTQYLNTTRGDARYYTESETDVISGALNTKLDTHKSSSDHDSRYYTETELNNGQLDSRYYTETEVNTISGDINTKLNTHKSSSDHDSRYYTETETDTISGSLNTKLETHKSSADHDGRYYTETELNNGQLDTRYYTETEVNTISGDINTTITTHKSSADHDGRYYTETELNNGQLDTRYYTETEVNTISGNLNTKITNLVGTSTDNYIARYNGTNSIQGPVGASSLDDSDNLVIAGSIKATGTTKVQAAFYAGSTAPTNVDRLNYDGYFYATRVYNAVYNDYADYQDLDDDLVFGKCYYDTKSGAKICNNRCQKSVIGVASNTYGHAVGNINEGVPIAIAGWVLAYVDKEYEIGTPLTNDDNGNLTEITKEEKLKYPERIVAIYKKLELVKYWGPQQILVDGRHWVKIK